jgi:basic membrane protein A and related proteins
LRASAVVAVLGALAVGLTFLPRRAGSKGVGAATAPQSPSSPAARVGLVFDVGGRGDKSFNDGAYLGLARAGKELGVEIAYLEPSGGEDREAALRLFAARDLDLVIGVGVAFKSDVYAVAAAYPKVHFACVDCAVTPDESPPGNVASLLFREEEGSFLVGAVAGLMTKTQHVGFVGGMTLPLIRKFEVGYAQGVKSVCPACEVHSAYAGATFDAFKDPAKGKTLAISQVSAGADVIFHASGATGHGVFEGARDAHVLAIGVDADQYDEMPGTVVTSMIKRLDVAVFDAIKGVTEHRFEGGVTVLGLKEGGIDWVHDGPHAALIPDAVKARVESLRQEISSGELRVVLPP